MKHSIKKAQSEKKIKERREAKFNEWEDTISLFEDLLDPLVSHL